MNEEVCLKSYYSSPIGEIVLTSNGEALTGLWFVGSRFIRDEGIVDDEDKILVITKAWLDRYFRGEKPNPKEIPYRLEGSEFSLKVWKILETIPYGQTITYGKIAKMLGKKMSAQAVGHAVGHNPISIIVPCHRVMGANNNLTGYGGGLDKKVGLLNLEGVNADDLYLPRKSKQLQ